MKPTKSALAAAEEIYKASEPFDHWRICPDKDELALIITRHQEKEREIFTKALEEICKGEGDYNRDRLIHAGNVIENAKHIAREALTNAQQLLKEYE